MGGWYDLPDAEDIAWQSLAAMGIGDPNKESTRATGFRCVRDSP